MKKILLLVLVLASTLFGVSAQSQIVIGNVIYEKVSDNNDYCIPKPVDGCTGDIVIQRVVKFDDNTVRFVAQIEERAFENCDKITSIKIPYYTEEEQKSCDNKYVPKTLYINAYAFANCTSLQTLDLPEKTSTFYLNAINNTNKLKTVICRASEKPADGNVTDFDKHEGVNLYVPDVSKYGEVGDGSFWGTFSSIKPLTEYQPEPQPEPTSFSIRIGGGEINIPSLKGGDKVVFTADNGQIVYIYGDSDPNKGETYTYVVPDNAGVVEISPAFMTEAMSSTADVEKIVPKVMVRGNIVEVMEADDEVIVIRNVNGVELYRGLQQKHELVPGVYILSVGTYNFKLAI